MTKQNNALRLATASNAMADEGEMIHLLSWHEIRNLLRANAAELRRLHAECEALRDGARAMRSARWYMLNKDGMATLCTSKKDAEKEARAMDMAWPHMGPHRAVQLVEVASVAASAGSEPVARVNDDGFIVEIGDLPIAPGQKLYLHPSPPEGMVGGLQVYRCKIKSRKQIDREIPRELQGWWADVAAGQKLLLRQAVQSDLDRCILGEKRSRNPADYMCETHTNGSLVSKVALEYMSPEQNVFAAPPTTSAGSGKGE